MNKYTIDDIPFLKERGDRFKKTLLELQKLVLQIQEKAFLAGRTRKESDGKEWKAADEFHYFNFGDYKKHLIESGEDFMIK